MFGVSTVVENAVGGLRRSARGRCDGDVVGVGMGCGLDPVASGKESVESLD